MRSVIRSSCIGFAAVGLGAALCCAQTVFAPPPDVERGAATPAIIPPMTTSNEANQKQLNLARSQGRAQDQVLSRMLSWASEQDEGVSGRTQAGPYRIAYTITAPEGSWRFRNGALQWTEPEPGASAHLRVFPMDAGDGRFVPELTIRAALIDAHGHQEAALTLPFAWYPLLNGYGANLPPVPPGSYTLRLIIQPPLFHRHDPHNGYRYIQTTVAVFPSITLDPARLSHAPAATDLEESNLALARPEAQALRNTLANMYKTAIGGRDLRNGDYIVANANEYSEAYWEFENGKFVYATEMENSAARNSHVEVAVMDSLTGRFVPGLHITASLTDASGHHLGNHLEPFMWHPWLWHYGANWRIPHNGLYTVHVHFGPPDFARYGKKVGDIMSRPVDLDFHGQKLISGEK